MKRLILAGRVSHALSPTRQSPELPRLRCSLIQTFLLTAALVFNGCTESPSFVKAGPLFVAAEKAPPSKALIYFYWPSDEQGRWSSLSVGFCDGSYESVLPGGYTLLRIDPGRQCFKAEGNWSLDSINAFGGTELASLDLSAEPGQTLFVRIEKGHGLFSDVALRSIEPAKAESEIGRCRQIIPMTSDEASRTLSVHG